MSSTGRLERVPGWAWVAAAFALRAAFALKLGDRLYQIDEIGFHNFSLSLAQTGSFTLNGQPIAPSPMPVAFFASFYALFGDHPLAPRLAQAVVSAATAWMAGGMTAEFSGSKAAGRLALAVSCGYPFFIYYSGILMSETLYVLFVTAALWMSGRTARTGAAGPAAIAGACWALAALTRIEAAPIAALIWLCVCRRLPWRTAALAALCCALPLSVWSLRNKTALGTFSPDNHGGMTLLHGTLLHDIAQAEDTVVAVATLEGEAWYLEAQRLPEAQRQAVYTRKALEFMKEHPATTLRHWGEKLLAFWRFYPRVDKVYRGTGMGSPDAGLRRGWLVAISLCFEPWLILIGFWGLWRLKGRPELLPALLFVGGSTAIHVLIVSMMRYRLAVMPVMILGATSILASSCAGSGEVEDAPAHARTD